MDHQWRTLQHRLSHAYDRFRHTVEQLAQGARERLGVCGEWSPKEVVAHLAGWDREAARRFHQFMQSPTEDIDYDLDGFNARSVAARQHLSWEQTLDELDDAHQELQQAIALVEPQHLEADSRFFGWLEGRSGDYEEHTVQIQAWLEECL